MIKGFKEEDVNSYVDYLNFIAKHAKFDGITTELAIKYVKLLSNQQQVILKKMQDMIAEDPKVYSANENTEAGETVEG